MADETGTATSAYSIEFPAVRFVVYLTAALASGVVGAFLADNAGSWGHDLRSAVVTSLWFATPALLVLAFAPVGRGMVTVFSGTVVVVQFVIWIAATDLDSETTLYGLLGWWFVGVPVAVLATVCTVVVRARWGNK